MLTVVISLVLLAGIAANVHRTHWYWSRGPEGSDFRIFVTAVRMIENGHGRDLYRFDVQQLVQQQLFPTISEAEVLPFNHLAYEVLFYWPFAQLPYKVGLAGWTIFNIGALLAVGFLLRSYTTCLVRRTRIWTWVWVLAFASVPHVISQGQDSALLLLLVTLSLKCASEGHKYTAGAFLGLGIFKFHIALPIFIIVVLAPSERRRLAAGFITTASAALVVSYLLVGDAIASDYYSMLVNQETFVPWAFDARYMANIRGLFELVLASLIGGAGVLVAIAVASGSVAFLALWAIWRAPHVASSEVVYGVAVATALLVSFHLHIQDVMLGVLPALVILEAISNRPAGIKHAGAALTAGASLYLYQLAALPFPILIRRCAILAIPLTVLWLTSTRLLRGYAVEADDIS